MALFGILNVHKPSGISSRDVVDRVERLTRPVRCGHAGTLDPLASGVLVICVGAATRLIQYVQRMPKRYLATFQLGCHSPTDDIEGDVTHLEGAPVPSRADIESVRPAFIGTIQQRPPDHSAVKIGGRRAYSLARKGQLVDLAPRPITIHSLMVRRFEYPELELDIECGSGTYVRALGRDLAAALSTGAVMSALVRTAIGTFTVDDAARLEVLTPDTLPCYLQPALTAVAVLTPINVSEAELIELRNGRPIANPFAPPPTEPKELNETREWAAVDPSGQLAAIVRAKRPGQLWPSLNLL